jgi:hypothetical protein
MMELRPHLAFGLDPLGPVHHHAIASAAKVVGHLFGPAIGD